MTKFEKLKEALDNVVKCSDRDLNQQIDKYIKIKKLLTKEQNESNSVTKSNR